MGTAIVGVAGAVLGALVTGVLAHFREKGNREHAVQLKKLDLEEQREQKWFDDRKEAYFNLLQITSVIKTDSYLIGDLSQSLALVQMVSNSSVTTDVANALVAASSLARKRANDAKKEGKKVEEDERARGLIYRSREAHTAFIAAVRAELYGAPFDEEAYGIFLTNKEETIPLE